MKEGIVKLPEEKSLEFNTFKDEFFDEKTAYYIHNSLKKDATPEKKQVLDSLYGSEVIDLGAGESRGGIEFAWLAQAMTYVAVDVDSSFSRLPKSEEMLMNVHIKHTDILSYLQTLTPREDGMTNNFLISGVDKNIISDQNYVNKVVSEIKKNSDQKTTVLVISPESLETNHKTYSDLNVFAPALKDQGFEIILNVNPMTNFWVLKASDPHALGKV